jgi:hypothetical protein
MFPRPRVNELMGAAMSVYCGDYLIRIKKPPPPPPCAPLTVAPHPAFLFPI